MCNHELYAQAILYDSLLIGSIDLQFVMLNAVLNKYLYWKILHGYFCFTYQYVNFEPSGAMM